MENDASKREKARMLIVDDDEANLATLEGYIALLGYDSESVRNGKDALKRVKQSPPDVILLDLMMPEMNGFEVARRLKSSPQTCAIPIIAVTALHDSQSNLKAIEAGVDHFLTKPIDHVMLKAHLSNLLRMRELSREVEIAQDRLDSMREYHRRALSGWSERRRLIGQSEAMKAVLGLIDRIKDHAAPVLILGESGTGKQLAAETIHREGNRASEAFIQINCANLQENLLESELFGHAKGAFTGAVNARKGLIEVADQGTLFVDEIGDMSRSVQAKLLVVLDSGLFRRVGETVERRANVRIIAATNRDLGEMVQKGEFRSDLFYRINVVPIELPPLRRRGGDIPLLTQYFLANSRFCQAKTAKSFSAEAMAALEAYTWPGNVRELCNAVERASVLSWEEKEITPAHLSPEIVRSWKGPANRAPAQSAEMPPLAGCGKLTLADIQLLYIKETLIKEKGNRTRVAKILGISRSTLKKKLQKIPLSRI